MSFGLKVRNANGQTVIDADYVNYALAFEGHVSVQHGVFTQVYFPYVLTGAAPPIVAFKRWVGSRFYVTYVLPIGGPGAWTGFQVRGLNVDRHVTGYGSPTSMVIQYRVYATDLPQVEPWGLQVFDPQGHRVFDSGRPLLTFRDQILGQVSLWSGLETAGAGNWRTTTFLYIGGATVGIDEYVAIGLFQSGGFGLNYTGLIGGGVATTVLGCFQGISFSDAGVPMLVCDAEDMYGYPVGSLVFLAFSPLPIIRSV